MKSWLSIFAWLSPQRCLERAGVRPPMQMTLGLVVLSFSILLFAKAIGILPNSDEALLQRRTTISEFVALNAASAVSNDDQTALAEFMKSIVGRYGEVSSVGLRMDDGSILSATPGHETNWAGADPHVNTPTHIQVPLLSKQQSWGHLEICFKPPSRPSTWIAWWSTPSVRLMTFVLLASFFFFWVYLSRMLRQLDPAGAIPERIQLLMNTMVEGIVILDDQGQIVLANESFAIISFSSIERLIGKKLSSLSWLDGDSEPPARYPWLEVGQSHLPLRGVLLRLQIGTHHTRRLTINASPILSPDDASCGTLVTFADQTILETENLQMTQLVEQVSDMGEHMRELHKQLETHANQESLLRLEDLAQAAKELAEQWRPGKGRTALVNDAASRNNDRLIRMSKAEKSIKSVRNMDRDNSKYPQEGAN